ncbi:hypothetical protein SmJEL517_g04984 [Synchytrium microbalum]|uniref:Uncharacterized protein n=1 Tax=Synchytrium microbalum TaxID=1806994 RepID=A0A507C2Q9_9FUNG|nr:uncharacterized protein SmJEL517_g04984 [Synchytrium microbalum]TPX31793.1 hypothetical protein SmJEL517_g04984 [Synchytrium microbalum]
MIRISFLLIIVALCVVNAIVLLDHPIADQAPPSLPQVNSSTPHCLGCDASTAKALYGRDLERRSGHIEPTPDTSYDVNGRGTVRVLVPRDRYEAPNSATLLRTQQAWAQASGLSIQWVPMASGTTYQDYLTVVLEMCNQTVASFTRSSSVQTSDYAPIDLVWIDAASGGILSDCLIDMWGWDSTLGGGHNSVILNGGVVPAVNNRTKRLVSLPAEADFGLMYYNLDILNRYGFSEPPKDLAEFETQLTTIIQAEHSLENYGLCGITSEYSATEGLTVNAIEWIRLGGGSILSSSLNNVTVATTASAQILVRVASWVTSNLIDPRDLSSTSDADAVNRFLDGKAVFLRSWTGVIRSLRASSSFNWGVMPMIPLENSGGVNPSVVGGWWLGVSRAAANPAAAIRVVKYLTSLGYQRMNTINGGANWMIPTYPSLMNGKICGRWTFVSMIDPQFLSSPNITSTIPSDVSVVNTIGSDVANLVQNVNITLRPALATSNLYAALSYQVSTTVNSVLLGQIWVVDALGTLDTSLRVLLGQSLLNAPNITNIDSSLNNGTTTGRGHASPSWLKTQLGGLLLVVALTCAGAALYKRKMMLQRKRKSDGFTELKEETEGPKNVEVAGIVEMVNVERTQKQTLV